MEHTGLYSRKLQFFLQDSDIDVCMESGFVIRRAGGIVKGKNDKIDAYRIAEYALSHKFKLRISEHYDLNITLLHDLLSTRNRIVEDLRRLTTPIQELKIYGGNENYNAVLEACDAAIKGLKESIKALDKRIDELIEQTENWKETVELATSVKGIGKLVCLWMMVYTRNFQSKINARQFASLVGIAPFDVSSGTSVKKGSHVSHHSHRFLKGILHTSAMTAIRNCKNIKQYHTKKKKEGKKGFVVMNNIKNKLVQTVFAVVKSKQPYHENFIHAKAA
jgi:transposase